MSCSKEDTAKVEVTPVWQQPVVRWAAGTFMLMAAASGLTALVMHSQLHGHGHVHSSPIATHSRPAAAVHTSEAKEAFASLEEVATAGGPESLEDALRHLESDNDAAAPRKKVAKSKASKQSKPSSEPATSSEADKKKARSIISDFIEKMKEPETDKASSKDGKKSKMDEALDKLEGKGAGDDDKEKAKSIIDDAMKKLGMPSGQKKTSDDDVQKARDIINEALGKKGSKGKDGKEGKDSALDELEALLGRETDNEEKKEEEEDTSHVDFAKLLKEEQERKPEHTVKDVKEEFTKEYPSDAKQLMCSGCKLIAARFGQEVADHDVHDQDSPHLMLGAKRRAINAACKSFRHLDVVQGHSGLKFEAVEASAAEEKRRIGQRLCMAVLEDARFDMLMKMIQSKVPHLSHLGATHKTNWERFLCAQHTRVCKRSEVRDDDEEADEL